MDFLESTGLRLFPQDAHSKAVFLAQVLLRSQPWSWRQSCLLGLGPTSPTSRH